MRIVMADQFFEDSAQPAPNDNVGEFSVSEISQAVKRTLEGAFGRVRIRGEVGRPNYHGSGHLYFTLKDADAAMDAVAWRGTAKKLSLRLEEGMEVIVTGKVSAYPKSSRYQIVVDSVELAGEGALLKLLEDRRKKLGAEGLFDAERKQDLPFLPEVIGVVTSPTGAVIRDILHRLNDRFPRNVLVWPVPVQGDGAAEKIAAAIDGFNAVQAGGAVPRPDLLIVARGGGSLEDLWQFNEEAVVRAVARSDIPLISAVGHETDTTLIDFVSDQRAPTPTAAAEMAVPVRAELLAQVLDDARRLVAGAARTLEDRCTRMEGLARGLPRPEDMLGAAQQSLDYGSERLFANMSRRLELASNGLATVGAAIHHPREVIDRKEQELTQAGIRLGTNLRSSVRNRQTRFAALSAVERLSGGVGRLIARSEAALSSSSQLLSSLSYERVLERGFALVRDAEGEPVLTAAATQTGQDVSMSFFDGTVGATITGEDLAPKFRKRPKPKKVETNKKGSRDGQGSLF